MGQQVELRQRGLDGLGHRGQVHAVQPRVQPQVLSHRQLFVQREQLRHVADVQPRAQVPRVHRLAQQAGPAFGDVEQAREHLHRRGLAAAVRAQEAEDLAALDAEVDVAHRGEITEAARQAFGLHGRLATKIRQGRDDQGLGLAALRQLDVGLFQVSRLRAGQHLGRGRVHQHAAIGHGHQVLESLGLFHVSRGHQHRHVRPLAAQAFDQGPELAARERVHARGRLVEDEQIRVVHQGAAQGHLLLHATRQLAGRPIGKRPHACGRQQVADARIALGLGHAEQARGEVHVVVDRERTVQRPPQPLRHVGDARQQALARGGVAQVGSHHMDQPVLDALDTRHDRQQRGLAHAIGPHQAHGAARGQAQGHVLQGQRVAIAVRHVLQGNCGLHGGLSAKRSHGGFLRWRAQATRARPRAAPRAHAPCPSVRP